MRTPSGARGRRRLPFILLLTLAAFGGALLSATAGTQSAAAQPAADLTITKTCLPGVVASGAFVECEIIITNSGTLQAFFPAVAPILRDLITDTALLTGDNITVPVRPANTNCTVTPQGPALTAVTCLPANSIPFLLVAGANARFVVRQSFTNTGTTPQTVTDIATADPNGVIPESNENNNTATGSFVVNPVPPALPDLSVTKSCTPATIASGGATTCTVIVTNAAGAGPANVPSGAVLVQDRFTGTAATSATITGTGPVGYSCAPQVLDGGSLVVNCTATAPDVIAPGTSRTFTFTQTVSIVSGTTGQAVTDFARADPNGTIPESSESNNDSNVVTTNVTPPPLPDLSATKSCTPATVASGGAVTCTVTVTNAAGASTANIPANAIVVQDRLTGTALTSGTVTGTGPAGFTCDPQFVETGSAVVNCRATAATTLAPGASLTFTFTQTVTINSGTAPQTVTDFARVDPAGQIPESSESNNDSNVVSTVITPPPGDLTTTKTCTPATVTSGAPVTCTVTVTNSSATGTILVPAGAILVQDRLTGTAATSGTLSGTGPAGYTCGAFFVETGSAVVNCTATVADTLAPGATRVFTFTQTVSIISGTTPQTVTDFGRADPAGTIVESNESNNDSATVSTVVNPPTLPSTLGLVKTCPDNVGDAEAFTCSIVVTNTGANPLTIDSGDTLFQDDLDLTATTTATNFVVTAPAGFACTNTLNPPGSQPVPGGPVTGPGGIRATCDATAATTLAAGASLTFTANITVDNTGATPQTIVNGALANPGGDIAGAPANQPLDEEQIIVAPTAGDLDLTKSCAPTTIVGGADSTCTVTITNTGPGSVTVPTGAVLFRDVLVDNPAATADNFSNSPATLNFTCTAATTGAEETTNTCVNSSGAPVVIANGASLTFLFQVSFTPASSGTATQTATLDPALAGPTGPDSGTVTLTIQPIGDLDITKTCAPDPVASGAQALCTVTITNAGPGPVVVPSGAVLVTDRVTYPSPALNAVLVDDQTAPAGYTCTPAFDPALGAILITCTRTGATETLAAGDTRTFVFVQQFDNTTAAPQTVSDTATENPAGTIVETAPGETASDTVVVQAPPANLTVTKDCPAGPVASGATFTCTIVITNGGAAAATFTAGQRVLNDLISSTVVGSTVGVQGFTVSVINLSCDAGGLPPGPPGTVNPGNPVNVNCVATGPVTIAPAGTVTITFNQVATNPGPGNSTVSDTATVDPDGVIVEGNEGDNTATDSLQVLPQAAGDLTIDKACTPATIPSGGTSNCTITITNNVAAGDVVVEVGDRVLRDVLEIPAGVTVTGFTLTPPSPLFDCDADVTLFNGGSGVEGGPITGPAEIRFICTRTGSGFTFTPGFSIQFTAVISATNAGTFAGNLVNRVRANPFDDFTESSTANNNDVFTIVVSPGTGDLDIAKVCTPVTRPSGAASNCTITITNSSATSPVTVPPGGILLRDDVAFGGLLTPTNVQDTSVPAGYSCSEALLNPTTIRVTCSNIGVAADVIAPNGTRTFVITQVFTNNSGATQTVTDTATENPGGGAVINETTPGETATFTTNVETALGNLVVDKSCPAATVPSGQPAACTIAVGNVGPAPIIVPIGARIVSDRVPFPAGTVATNVSGVQAADPQTPAGATATCTSTAEVGPSGGPISGPNAIIVLCTATSAFVLAPGQEIVFTVTEQFTNNTSATVQIVDTATENPFGDIAEASPAETDADDINVASGASTLTAAKICAPFISIATFYTINCTITVANTGSNPVTFDVGDTVLLDGLGPIPAGVTVSGFTITATNSTQNCVLVTPIPPFPGAGPGASLFIRCDIINTAVTLAPLQSLTHSVVINGNEIGSGQQLPNTIATNPDGDVPNVPTLGGPFVTTITFP